MWLSLPRSNFDEAGIIISMLELTHGGALAEDNLQVLWNELIIRVSKKKFLIILDDIWYDEKQALVQNQDR